MELIDFAGICARHGIHLRTYRDCPGLVASEMPPGLAAHHNGTDAIFYNDEQPEAAQQFTLAHELAHERLGHLVMPRPDASAVYDSDKWREIEANIYAIVMLAVAEVMGPMKQTNMKEEPA